MFGTIMAFNVWFRIWPAQQQIIRATKEGTPPDAERWSALAGTRSEAQHLHVGAAHLHHDERARAVGANPLLVAGIVLVGWGATYWLYNQSKTVKGF